MSTYYLGSQGSGLFDADLRHWLALPKSLYAVDGLTCNKIGVSYTPYRDQPNRCFATPSSCLRSQIADYQIASTIPSPLSVLRAHGYNSNSNL